MPGSDISQFNPEIKRSFVQPETWARERVRGVATASRELQSNYPDFVGLVLFGSLVKGTSRDVLDQDPSDIDAFGFVEIPDELLVAIPRSTSIETSTDSESTTIFTPSNATNTGIISQYTNYLRESIEQHTHIPHELTNDCKVLPLSPTLVTKLVAETCDLYTQQDLHSDHKIYMGQVPQQLERIFHIGVGGTRHLDKYRKQILQLLQEQGEIGVSVWKEMVGSVQMFENPSYIQFPQTPTEAIEYFGLS